VLQSDAVCCSVLQCVAVCCSVLHCVAVCCSVLQCITLCCSVLQCVAACCSVLQRVAVCCRVLHCAAACCSVLMISSVLILTDASPMLIVHQKKKKMKRTLKKNTKLFCPVHRRWFAYKIVFRKKKKTRMCRSFLCLRPVLKLPSKKKKTQTYLSFLSFGGKWFAQCSN